MIREQSPFPKGKVIAIVAMTVAIAVMLVLHRPHWLNGIEYWQWSWRRLDALRLYLPMALAALPFFAAQLLYQTRRKPAVALALLFVSTVALQLAAISAQPPFGMGRLVALVENSVNTSYFIDAKVLYQQQNLTISDWLTIYPEMLPKFHWHARFKPPGLILYYTLFIHVLGPGSTAALAGGLGVAVMAALAAPATHWLVRRYAPDNPAAAFAAASWMALCPSLILFLPQFDQIYPAIACAMLVAWSAALSRANLLGGIAFGAVLALALFLSYIFLILGLFLAVLSMFHVAERGWKGAYRVAMHAIVAIAMLVLLYLLLEIATGFNALTTSEAIRVLQAVDLVHLGRPFPLHMAFDAIDILMGTGWIAVPLVLMYLIRERRGLLVQLVPQAPAHRLAFLASLQVAATWATALFPGETARLWLPMFPLVAAVVGLELARWPARARLLAYLCLWALLVLTCQSMTFLYMGPDLDGPRV